MGKVTKAVVLDDEQWNQLPIGQRSKVIRDLIGNYLAYQSKDIDRIDAEILMRKVRSLENKKLQITTELESLKSTLTLIEEKRERDEQSKLEEEKKRIEESKQCIECKRILEEGHKRHEFASGLVCQGCFMSSTVESVKRWNTNQ